VEILTIDEAAELLRMTPDQLRALARRGAVPAHRLPGTRRILFFDEELVAWLRAHDAAGKLPARRSPSRARKTSGRRNAA
jgi:excisionase family DNA binding protein